MPYATRKGDGESYEVYNTDTGDVKAMHEPPDAKEKAERQVKLLAEIENDPEWNGSDD